MKILGFDPGVQRLGFGLVVKAGNDYVAETYGIIETDSHLPRASRLSQIMADLEALLDEIKPDLVCVEELFFVQNITNGIQVAEARGVILAVVDRRHIPIVELKPNQIKTAICGNGQADKVQVQTMVAKLLKLDEIPKPDDAADALAVAITGGQLNQNLI